MHGRTRTPHPGPGWPAFVATLVAASLASLILVRLAGAGDSPAPASAPAARAAYPPAPGGLLIAPTRVVFEGSTRAADLTLVNTGSQTATYRIGFVRFQMTEKGEIRPLRDGDSTGAGYSDSMVRYAPRRVTLAPQVPQTVRLQLRKPEGLPEGEYRSHLMFQAIPEPARAGAAADTGGAEVRFHLVPVFGVSVPVIVRSGDTRASVSISGLELQPGTVTDSVPRLRLTLNRSGNQSVYGNLTASLEHSDGSRELVGAVNGVAVYTPLARRYVELRLHLPRTADLSACRLRVGYGTRTGAGDASQAEAILPLR